MSTDKKRAHELLQIVEDSYTRTANIKASYERYKNLLHWESRRPLNPEEYRQLREYKEIFKAYEENINMEKKMFWYEGNEPPRLGETGACDPEGDPQPIKIDPLDEFLAGCKWKGTYFDTGDYSVEGNVYSKGKFYYISFDGTDTGDFLDDVFPFV